MSGLAPDLLRGQSFRRSRRSGSFELTEGQDRIESHIIDLEPRCGFGEELVPIRKPLPWWEGQREGVDQVSGNHILFHPHPASPIEGEEKLGTFPEGN